MVSNRHGHPRAQSRHGDGSRSQGRGKKQLIEGAYEQAEEAGLPLWCQDEAGPYQAIPQPGEDWHLEGKATAQPHEYVRGGTAKLLTLFRPATGLLQAKGVLSAPNALLHPWLQDELQGILDQLEKTPLPVRVPLPEDHPLMLTWQRLQVVLRASQACSGSASHPESLDNLKGHLSYTMVRWLLQHGILPLYTPLSGSWREYWPNRCSASSCAEHSLASIQKTLSK